MIPSDSLGLFGCGRQGVEQVNYWDLFFQVRNGRAVEWYSDWTDLQGYLAMLVPKHTKSHNSVKILVSGCGNSELSAHMYDIGWLNITNVDFSKVVIAEMLRLHVRSRPRMRWQVMDMTHLQVKDACFDVVLDKGSLDSLMADTTLSSLAARSYLSEVKRVLRPGGKYACVTAAHYNVLGLLLETFRQGWLLNVHRILLVSNSASPQLHPYLVYAVKSYAEEIAPVKCFFGEEQNADAEVQEVDRDGATVDVSGLFRLVNVMVADRIRFSNCPFFADIKLILQRVLASARVLQQMQFIDDLIKEENRFRFKGGFTNPSDVFSRLHQGRRISIKLGKHYPAVVLDAKSNAEPPALRCGVFLVPKSQAREWLFSSEEGQWQVVETAQAGRLILVTLNAQQTDNMNSIEKELSPLVKPLLPLDCRDSDTIIYMTTNDALTRRTLLEEIESPMTGMIHVEEVIVPNEDSFINPAEESKPRHYRRLVFRRNPNLIQSEASLIPVNVYSKVRERTKNEADFRRRQSGNKKKLKSKDSTLSRRTGSEELRIDFSYLASEYHAGIISGLSLIAHSLEQWISAKEPNEGLKGTLAVTLNLKDPSVPQGTLEGLDAKLYKGRFACRNNLIIRICVLHYQLKAVGNIDFHSISLCNPLMKEYERRAMIVGLGAGLLPMFVRNHIPVDTIQVVELDGLVGDLAKRHFGFVEDDRMQLCISDGVEAIDAIAKRNLNRSTLPRSYVPEVNTSPVKLSSRMSTHTSVTREVDSEVLHVEEVLAVPFHANGFHGPSRRSRSEDENLHILIIDADSEDPSTGLSCPPAKFLEETFLRSAKEVLVDGGILAINVVSRASSPHITSMALLQKVFEEVYYLEIEEHVNRVLFALPRHSDSCHKDGHMQAEVMEAARTCFERLAGAFAPWDNGPSVKDYLIRLKRLK